MNEEKDLRALTDAVKELSADQRDILILRYHERLSIKEIASLMGRPEKDIKKMIIDALKILRLLLKIKGGIRP